MWDKWAETTQKTEGGGNVFGLNNWICNLFAVKVEGCNSYFQEGKSDLTKRKKTIVSTRGSWVPDPPREFARRRRRRQANTNPSPWTHPPPPPPPISVHPPSEQGCRRSSYCFRRILVSTSSASAACADRCHWISSFVLCKTWFELFVL